MSNKVAYYRLKLKKLLKNKERECHMYGIKK